MAGNDAPRSIDRRSFLAASAGLLAMAPGLVPSLALASTSTIHRKPIPKSGETIPAIGMGSWITFNVGNDPKLRNARAEVLRRFFEMGGGMVDSSPMYGSSEAVIGYGLHKLGMPKGLFSATKVWTPSTWHGKQQMDASEALWGLKRFDLYQVHNLVDWEGHLETLRAHKAAGRVRYIGLTTSHGMRHDDMAHIAETVPGIDFLQLTYNVADREAERRLLPLAAERGIAVIANRPFQGGHLIDRLNGKPLPAWAADAGAATWAQFLLKFIVSHPALTCAIPATSRVDHMTENMTALTGPLPDATLRKRMIETVESL